jgi:hypothetical protein
LFTERLSKVASFLNVRSRNCASILDGQTENIQPFSIIAKLLWFLYQNSIYGTIRKGKVYKTSKEAHENRTGFFFTMSEAQEHLKISRQDLMKLIFDWIKEITPSGGSRGHGETSSTAIPTVVTQS